MRLALRLVIVKQSIFYQDWEDGRILGAMPNHLKKRMSFYYQPQQSHGRYPSIQ